MELKVIILAGLVMAFLEYVKQYCYKKAKEEDNNAKKKGHK